MNRFFNTLWWSLSNPIAALRGLENAFYAARGAGYSASREYWRPTDAANEPREIGRSANRLREYFDAHTEGQGIFKLLHYFDIYHRHFQKFVDQEVHIVEVGVYSGGSLEMWQDYFGEKCTVYGIDIMEECRAYESEKVKIFIGDQADRSFWNEFRKKVPRVDILIDDGGHLAEQQIVTLEEMLPHISPGGVYICEDVSGSRMKMTAYMNGLQNELNSILDSESGPNVFEATPFQQQISSIHQYPFVFVIEKRDEPLTELHSVKMGTIWNPSLRIDEPRR